ncbi:MAG TPA: DUF4339 domain-containing protein [Gemmataceae bacterium]|nr:DUF4339 domain-containing protein [Gemmataceae bacterium]
MGIQWYYSSGDSRQGPFSAAELQSLAEAGKIQPNDTVWKEGVAQGVLAHRVKGLFTAETEPVNSGAVLAPPLAVSSPATASAAAHESVKEPSAAAETIAAERHRTSEAENTAASTEPLSDLLPVQPEQAEPSSQASAADRLNPPEETDPEATPARKPPAPQPPPRKGRASAVRGAIIVSQDGTTVYFRKKCIKCGHEETGRNRLPIRNGVTRAGYFCPKCRKLRPVEIQGQT